ncbi:MAG: hypothetical protein PHO41_10360 [Eubacteriales bacterium]|nr:hypothetical protein [Eubacteriales bacterium]
MANAKKRSMPFARRILFAGQEKNSYAGSVKTFLRLKEKTKLSLRFDSGGSMA